MRNAGIPAAIAVRLCQRGIRQDSIVVVSRPDEPISRVFDSSFCSLMEIS